MEENKPHCFNYKHILVIFDSNFCTKLFENLDVLFSEIIWCQELDWLEQAQSHINLKELGFIDSPAFINLKFS